MIRRGRNYFAGLLLFAAAFVPAASQSATPLVIADMNVADCASADAALHTMHMKMTAVATGDLDHDFAKMASQDARMMAAATSLEMRCGKIATMRKMAEQLSMRNDETLRLLGIGVGATH
ncbi:MAG: hypothetical protein IAI50_01760 [Candidatus Eremiobacteraeota bacterium]|nr:hypothetical protein [Candidatus Eremiobacteraeota bacterium]